MTLDFDSYPNPFKPRFCSTCGKALGVEAWRATDGSVFCGICSAVVQPRNDQNARLLVGDCLEVLKGVKPNCVSCCVTSPPYWGQRNYDADGQVGLESSPAEYVEALVSRFDEVRRVLRKDGTLWVVIGDAYVAQGGDGQGKSGMLAERPTLIGRRLKGTDGNVAGLRRKNLLGLPWRFAFAMQDAGWNLRLDLIWHKPNALPESVKDRCTRDHEYIMMFSRSQRYYYDAGAIAETSVADDSVRNRRSVWSIPTTPGRDGHPAAFPLALAHRCILAGSPPHGLVLDPFSGSATTGEAALLSGRRYLGIEINEQFNAGAERRLSRLLYR